MVKRILKIVLIAWLITIPLKQVFQAFEVQGASMEAEIHDRDRLLIEEVSYRFHDPARGDMIVFRSPEDQAKFFVKRVIGLPGETVRIENNQILISSKAQPQGRVLDERQYLDASQTTAGDITMTLDDNEFFVLGDNRRNSSDSRSWGPVNRSLITGRVFSRAWPLTQAELFHAPHY